MNTVNKVLIGVLVAQVALALIVHTRTDATQTIRRPEPLLPGLDAAQIQRVAIFKARDPEFTNTAAEDGPALELRREGTGETATWTLASHHGYPVRDGVAQELTGKLAALQTTGPVVTSEVRHGQLEVSAEHYRRKVVIETADGATRTLLIGKPSRARQSFVRIDGQNDVHAVSDISESGLNVQPSHWIDSKYLLLQSKDVAYMSVRNRNGTYEFQRNESDRWTLVRDGAPYPVPPGKKFNSLAADNWVKDMLRLNVSAPADPKRQIDTPLATVTLRMKPSAAGEAAPVAPAEGAPAAPAEGAPAAPGAPGGAEQPVEHVIEIGAKDGELYYVRMSGTPHAAMVRSPRFSAIIAMNDDVVMIPEK
jgi:hypothetical protein